MRGIRRIIGISCVMLVMGCNSGLIEEKEGLEKRNSFLDSLVKIGQGFQDIFGVFGNVIGDALGFNVVKSGDKRSEVGRHFEKIKKGLEDTNGKLKELSGDISGVKNVDGSTTKVFKEAIQGVNEVFDKLIGVLTKLAGVTNDSSILGATANNSAAVGAEEASVNVIIESVKAIVEVAKKSGIEIKSGDAGGEVAGGATTAPAALVGKANSAAPDANSGPKLAAEVSKADPWAMIDKIQNAVAKTGNVSGDNTNEAGVLAVGNGVDNAGAKTNADLAAAVALKAITKGGKLSSNNGAGEAEAVRAAATSAVNKVLGILDLIIMKTVNSNLEKVKEIFKSIEYSEIPRTEATETGTVTK
ncbi:variable large family protein [Borrelia persica]|uniref:variable large family protein n=1 Tax=Borrelia persica TaxID=44448 RepID=UPI0004655676|nr:variable large family protein [Borrelia persica]